MPRGGSLRKPAEVRRRAGNPGHANRTPPEAELVLLDSAVSEGPPEPLGLLGTQGRALWDQVCRTAAHWLAESDLHTLQTLCETMDDYTAWRIRSLRQPDDWRAAKRVYEYRQQMLTLGVELGLSPTARARLGVAEVRMREGIARLSEAPVIAPKETFA